MANAQQFFMRKLFVVGLATRKAVLIAPFFFEEMTLQFYAEVYFRYFVYYPIYFLMK